MASSYTYVTFGTRAVPAANHVAAYYGDHLLGVKVMIPSLAAACSLGNINPHVSQDAGIAAIETAVAWPLPPSGTVIATISPDADSLGAMAVLSLREEGVAVEGDIALRIAQISLAVPPLSALKARVAYFHAPIEERIEVVREFLLTGEFAS